MTRYELSYQEYHSQLMGWRYYNKQGTQIFKHQLYWAGVSIDQAKRMNKEIFVKEWEQ
jgi:hypothetical protein